MIENFLYLILAILGLGFLVFIHELGHYLMARRVGMRVETFSIGFGKPIHSWQINGVRWQICWIPFGGYVRIAGMEKIGILEPYQIQGGFYSKTPWERIQVALAGPLVNIIFALIVFSIVWISGGQQKPFQQYTNVIGAINPSARIYHEGVRAGDIATEFNAKPFTGFSELLMDVMLSKNPQQLQVNEVDYTAHKKKNFTYLFKPEQKGKEAFLSLGITPAEYLFFSELSSSSSPMKNSGIKKNDRIVSIDGEFVFSRAHLNHLLNDSKSLITIRRQNQILQARIPRIKTSDVRMDQNQKAEIEDWAHELNIHQKISALYFIPYNITHNGVVESQLTFIDPVAEEYNLHSLSRPLTVSGLEIGDQILAVDGAPIRTAVEFLEKIQSKKVHVVVQRKEAEKTPLWTQADPLFMEGFSAPNIQSLLEAVGTKRTSSIQKEYVLLNPVELQSFSSLSLEPKTKALLTSQYEIEKKQIEKIADSKQKQFMLSMLDKKQNRLMLGIVLKDSTVSYNPSPFALFSEVVSQTWKTLSNLFTGTISPKGLSGPVGIVQALQFSWSNGIKDAFFWLGFVSFNLAIVNLLPVPVLDGGHVLLAAVEQVTKRPLKAKTMEKLILPFIVLLIAFFIYVTYQDAMRIFENFFR